MNLISFQSEYATDPDILALAGLSLAPMPEHECAPEVPESPPRFAQTMFAGRPHAHAFMQPQSQTPSLSPPAPAPEPTPELEPESETAFGDSSTAASLVSAIKARQRAARLLAASAGPRLMTQPQPQPQTTTMSTSTSNQLHSRTALTSTVASAATATGTSTSSHTMTHNSAGMPPLPRRPSAPSRTSAARTSWRSAGTDSTFGLLSLPSPSHSQAASQTQRSDSFSSARNDMILLAAPEPSSPKFVVFADRHRESIFVRPSDGSDMIPLDLSSRC
ncbi:hypothetical protein PINS_up007654 [Pythium insidiosum]|nr:hypothetical protein PINS_up007654 [Pythium insidiosum]